jgi:2-aminoadipate transaminase
VTELQPNTTGQHLVVEFARRGWLEEQIERARSTYGSKCKTMDMALRLHRLPGLRWTVPAGGMFLWLQLPEQVDAQVLLAETAQKGVVFLPGSLMYPTDGLRHVCRLNFSMPDQKAIERGIAIIAAALRRLHDTPVEALEGRVAAGPIV